MIVSKVDHIILVSATPCDPSELGRRKAAMQKALEHLDFIEKAIIYMVPMEGDFDAAKDAALR